MTYRIDYIDSNKAKEIEDKIGGYNDMPPNMVDIDESEFFSEFRRKSWKYYGPRQACADKERRGRMTELHLWFDRIGDGVGFKMMPVPGGRHGDVRPVYFKFGPCVHDYVHKNVGRCLHRYTCSNCGHSYEIDSSD